MPNPDQSEGGKPVNKSAAIRDMLAQNPQAKSQEIVSLLGKQKIRVRPSLVYYIKSQQKQQQRKEKRQRVAATSQNTGTINPVELILQVKTLARDAGGI